MIAQHLGARFIMLRKPGKLPGKLLRHDYDLEYGQDSLEIQQDAVKPGEQVLIHDDVLATGGTASAARKLVALSGGVVSGFSFLIELSGLRGIDRLPGC